jgi:hypothetical protein
MARYMLLVGGIADDLCAVHSAEGRKKTSVEEISRLNFKGAPQI